MQAIFSDNRVSVVDMLNVSRYWAAFKRFVLACGDVALAAQDREVRRLEAVMAASGVALSSWVRKSGLPPLADGKRFDTDILVEPLSDPEVRRDVLTKIAEYERQYVLKSPLEVIREVQLNGPR